MVKVFILTRSIAVQMVTTRNLLKIKGFSEAKVDKIKVIRFISSFLPRYSYNLLICPDGHLQTLRLSFRACSLTDIYLYILQESASKLIRNGFISATELSERRKFILKLSTGCKDFDEVSLGTLLYCSKT